MESRILLTGTLDPAVIFAANAAAAPRGKFGGAKRGGGLR